MMAETVPIHLNVPGALKARWVRESRTAGMRLTDWIVSRVEAQAMQQPSTTTISIPTGLTFADLKLARSADGMVSFDTSVIARIEAFSGLPEGHFLGRPEDELSDLITQWYRAHLAAGGAPDPVQEDLIGEVRAEDAAGQHASHAPGRA